MKITIVLLSLALTGCVVAPPAPMYSSGYGDYAPGYVAPVVPPVGVGVMPPIGVSPGIGWGWGYHPRLGWGWHNPRFGWRHR